MKTYTLFLLCVIIILISLYLSHPRWDVLWTCTSFFDYNQGERWTAFQEAMDSIVKYHTPQDLEKIQQWIVLNEYSPPVVHPGFCSFALQNLQIGGIPLSVGSDPILQNLSLNFDLERTPLYGLGSNYVYNRKLEYPINGSISLAAQVSGFSSGFLSGMLYNESGYSFDLAFSEPLKSASGFYNIKNAKLDSFNYSMAVNDVLNFNAQFSVEVSDYNGGFCIDRSIKKSLLLWNSINSIWNNISTTWQLLQ